MAKDPAFLFYPNDFSSGTQFFSNEQVGKYLRLLLAQHQHGHLTGKQMQIVCGGIADAEILEKFIIDSDGKYYNKRLDDEIVKRKKHSEKQKVNANMRWHKNGIDLAMPLENRNRNEDEDIIKKKVLEIFNSEKWQQEVSTTYGLTIGQCREMLSAFIKELELKDDLHKSIKEIKSHFINSLKLKKQKPNGFSTNNQRIQRANELRGFSESMDIVLGVGKNSNTGSNSIIDTEADIIQDKKNNGGAEPKSFDDKINS